MSVLLVFGAAVVAGFMVRSAAVGLAVLGYGVAIVIWLRQRRARLQRQERQAVSLELMAGTAADLRAGSSVVALDLPDGDLDAWAGAAMRVSERTGAGLAGMLERLETQQRALSRLDSAAYAQASGIRLTVLLLLLLPMGALATGEAIGASPVRVLLRTGLGTLCVAMASGLQLTGIAWSNRLTRPADRQPQGGLAFAADLVAAALQAGAPVDMAVLAAGDALTGQVARQLRQVGYALHWGVAPDAAWAQFLPPAPRGRRLFQLSGGTEGAHAPERQLVQAAQRSGASGAALAGALTRCADQIRADTAHDRQAKLQRAGVLLVLPLGLCFLPAFLLAGLVPVVVAVLAQVM
jgi:Flp pilus assembly protein TadB